MSSFALLRSMELAGRRTFQFSYEVEGEERACGVEREGRGGRESSANAVSDYLGD